MSKLSPTWLTLILLITGVVGWLAVWFTTDRGLSSPVLPGASLITLAGIGVLNLGLGIWVYLSKRRKINRPVSPLVAARTVVLAQAAAYGGALVAGWHAGILLYLYSSLAGGSATTAWGIGYVIAGLALVVIGFVVEYLCRIDLDDDEEDSENGSERMINGIDPAKEEGGYARKSAQH